MRTEKNLSESIRIVSPCTEDWNEMTGNEQTRACSHCEMDVNDISMMSETEALKLINRTNGNLCVRYESDPVTNAPIFADKLYQITRRTGVAAGVLGATLAVSTSAYAQSSGTTKIPVSSQTTVSNVKQTNSKFKTPKPPKVSPTPPKTRPKTMGKIAFVRRIKNPLMIAVNQGRSMKVRLMIASGANVNEVDTEYYSRTALHVAVERNNLQILQTLLNSGADVNMQDQHQKTPLMMINWNTSGEILQLLVQHGADLDKGNSNGQTALMDAARYGNINAVKALLESGANVDIRDGFGNSALDIASSKPVIELLIAYGATQKTKE